MKPSLLRSAAIAIGAALLPVAASAQVVVPGGTVANSGNSNMGIAIPNPQTPLHVGGVNGIRIDTYGGTALQNQDGLGNLLWYIKRGNSVDVNDMAMRAYSGFSFAPANSDAPLIRFAPSGNVGVGITSPSRQMHIFGAGQAVSTGLKDVGNSGGTLYVQDAGSMLYNGGAILFGAAQGFFASIKSEITDGSARTLGNLSFETRNSPNDSALTPRLVINSSGKIGIGTASPCAQLDVANSFYANQGTLVVRPQNTTVEGGEIALAGAGSKPMWIIDNCDTKLRLFTGNSTIDNTSQVQIFNMTGSAGLYVQGNVGIGITNPTNKLEVNGTIRTKEVIVETTGWSDYVFAPDYRLTPLSEVEAAIKASGHLPGIPSAAEVAEHGVSLGDMQAKLLAKMEELTLHVISQEKRIAQLEAENAALRSQ